MASRRRYVAWKPILGGLLVADCLAALFYSPLFALTVVRVVGYTGPRFVLQDALRHYHDESAPWLHVRQMESRVQGIPGVEIADMNVNLYGRGRLIVKMRRPVARIESTKLAIGEDGEIWSSSDRLDRLPSVRLPAAAYAFSAALARPLALKGLGNLAAQLPEVWPDFKGQITLNETGVLCLNRGESGRVVLGGSDALEEKLDRLANLLRDRPKLFTSPNDINLTSPKHPAVGPWPPHPHEATHEPPVGQ